MIHYKIELLVSGEGFPLQATVVAYKDGEQERVTTHAVEPFVSWKEVMQDLLDGLPIQLRLL